MMKPLKMRLLAAALVAIPTAFWFLGREKSKLVDWTTDPQAAQVVYLDYLRHMSLGRALAVMLVFFLGLTLLVEGLSTVMLAVSARTDKAT